jgi:carbonic anhydrase/acetyltransferase-like protein (isoleucine patch superfamily)
MQRYIFEETRYIPPFNQPASLLSIGASPLKTHQEDVIADYFGRSVPIAETYPITAKTRALPSVRGPAIAYSDNLWFDREFLEAFMKAARARTGGRPCRAAIRTDDPAYRTYTLPLARNFERLHIDGRELALIDLWYVPGAFTDPVEIVVIESDAAEIGFYSVPDFMTMEQGALTHYAPMRSVMSIESWVHIYFASIIFGLFARSSRFDRYVNEHNLFSLKLLMHAVLEQRQILSSSRVVEVGRGTVIHPTAVITGPAKIGANCNIGPGVMLDNCTIGDNVTIDDGCTLMMSTVANGCFLPFRASLYLTNVMENTIIAQNTCLQMCVIGRNSFVGAGSTFTDFNLVEQRPIRAQNMYGDLVDVGQVVLGSAVGHNCRIGSGIIMFPGRMIESDVVLIASPQRRVVGRNIGYEESDHLHVPGGRSHHKRFYPRPDEHGEAESW